MNGWLLKEEGYNPEKAGYYETIFTLANGYMGVRSNLELGSSYRKGTYLAGVYDKSDAQVIELVNCPSFFNPMIEIDGEPVDMMGAEVISHYRKLDMKKGLLSRKTLIEDKKGQRIKFETTRFLSLADPHLAGIRIELTPVNFSAQISLISNIDGKVRNFDRGSKEYFNHHQVVDTFKDKDDNVVLKAVTNDMEIVIINALGMNMINSDSLNCNLRQLNGDNSIGLKMEFEGLEGKSYIIDNYISTFTSRDLNNGDLTVVGFSKKHSLEELIEMHLKKVKQVPLLNHFNDHSRVLAEKWELADFQIKGDLKSQLAVRYNIFNLLMLGSNLDGDVSIGAKGLHGEGYKGHIFWDTEIYMLPFFIYIDPENARKLLMYRCRRLDSARRNAIDNGYRGAQFPWESAATGLETTPEKMYLPDGTLIRVWTGDEEIHISADIAFAFYEYYRISGDREFYLKYAAEVILATARFWASRFEYNQAEDYYEIKSVTGPDEFHSHTDNSYFTNYMARWNMLKAVDIYRDLSENSTASLTELAEKVDLTETEINQIALKAEKIYLPENRTGIEGFDGVIEEFDNYFQLKDFIIDKYDELGMPDLPLHLQHEPELVDYQLIKQADVVLLTHLFNEAFSLEQKRVNYEYYEKRTTHLSSLSPSTYCLMGIEVDNPEKAYKYFDVSANVDIADNQANTSEGIHAASLGGTWQAAVFGFGGFRVRNDHLHISPWLPENWDEIGYSVLWQGRTIRIRVSRKRLLLKVSGENKSEIEVWIYNKKYSLPLNREIEVNLA